MLSGNLKTKANYILGTNSYEGLGSFNEPHFRPAHCRPWTWPIWVRRAPKRKSILAISRYLGIWWFEIWKYYKCFSYNKWLWRTGIVWLNRFEKPDGGQRIPDEEGQPSIARRYKYIPKEMQQKVVDKYFDFHKGNSRHQHSGFIRHQFMSPTFDKLAFKIIWVSRALNKSASTKQNSLLVLSMARLNSQKSKFSEFFLNFLKFFEIFGK